MDTPNEQTNFTRLQKKCQALRFDSSRSISNRQRFLDPLWTQAGFCRKFLAIEYYNIEHYGLGPTLARLMVLRI